VWNMHSPTRNVVAPRPVRTGHGEPRPRQHGRASVTPARIGLEGPRLVVPAFAAPEDAEMRVLDR
jgi:hypothetical protein